MTKIPVHIEHSKEEHQSYQTAAHRHADNHTSPVLCSKQKIQEIRWGAMAERFSPLDLCSEGRVVRIWFSYLDRDHGASVLEQDTLS